MPSWTNEQKLAIEKEGTNIIVSAGAGSGKTAVLTARVIRKLKEGVNINELLILTFTEAAAKEMKERIRKSIRKEESLKKQLELIDSAYITTFDSYALSIVKKYYYLLNISPNVKVADSNIITIKKEEFLDEVLEKYYEDKNEKFEKLLKDFTNKNDKVIRNNIIKINDKLDTIPNKKEYLNNYLNIYFSEEKIKKNINEFNNVLLNKINSITNLIHSLSFYVDGEYITKLNEILLPLINSKNYNEIKNNLDIKLPVLRNAEEEGKAYKENIKEIIDELKKICVFTDEKEIYDTILSTKEYIEVILEILKELDKKINEYKTKNELYEFLDIELLAIKLLKEHKEVANEIKNNLNEIMIDEYQDTNDIQEEFISYISNNNVYMVGDVKQSIYRFRNANPYIFKNKYDNYSKNLNGFKIDLNKNFRSREEVLSGINEIFSNIMDDDIGGANYKETHKMIFGNMAYNNEGKSNQNNDLEIYNYVYDKESGFKKEEYEIFIIANDIKQKVESGYLVFDKDTLEFRKINYSDFVILINKSKSFDLYKKIFEYLNIPLTILKDENLKDEVLLHIIKNLLTLSIKINNKEYDSDFKHSFISILRSPLFEYSDDQILNMFVNNDYLNNELIKFLKKINIDSITTKELLNYYIDEFNIYEKMIKIGNIDSSVVVLEYLLKKADELNNLGYSIYDYEKYLNDILDKDLDIKFSVNKEEASSVKIMTIHKSKGLEYSICYFPELYNEFNKRDLNELFLFDQKYGIITPYYDDGINDTVYKYLLKENFNKEEISERLRLFYVSLTRAKEKMILVTDLSKEVLTSKDTNGVIDSELRLKFKSFNDIILSIKDELKPYIKEVKVENLSKDYDKVKDLKIDIEKSDKILNVNELTKDNTLSDEKSFSKDLIKLNTINEIENMKFGTYIHYILETIDLKSKDINHVPEQYKDTIKRFLEIDLLKDLDNANIYKEYEFMYEKQNTLYHGIIDLMIEKEDEIYIIDYKLNNIDDENYIKQLSGYKEYIEDKFDKKVSIYLYSILSSELRKLGD